MDILIDHLIGRTYCRTFGWEMIAVMIIRLHDHFCGYACSLGSFWVSQFGGDVVSMHHSVRLVTVSPARQRNAVAGGLGTA